MGIKHLLRAGCAQPPSVPCAACKDCYRGMEPFALYDLPWGGEAALGRGAGLDGAEG